MTMEDINNGFVLVA